MAGTPDELTREEGLRGGLPEVLAGRGRRFASRTLDAKRRFRQMFPTRHERLTAATASWLGERPG
jgi:hypothetical protein